MTDIWGNDDAPAWGWWHEGDTDTPCDWDCYPPAPAADPLAARLCLLLMAATYALDFYLMARH
jgi:hypothetical protein